MTKKITASIGRDGVLIHVPYELITALLKPRVIFQNVQNITRREGDVLKGVMRGLANKEIAAELSLSERTIKFHVSSLFAKTKTKSRADLQVMCLGLAKNGEENDSKHRLHRDGNSVYTRARGGGFQTEHS